MTRSLLHYSIEDYRLPPEPAKPSSNDADKPRPSKPSRPLPAEARWLLWQWSRVIGLDQSTSCHVRTLCQRLGTTPQHWSRIVRMLEACGVMVTSPIPQQRGRPLTNYRISAQVRYDLANLTVPEMCHRPEIARVLAGRNSQSTVVEAGLTSNGRHANLLSAEARKHRLTPANRWLIAVLLAHAETPGRVSGLSYTRLGRLTGMSRNQLQSQLAKLREQGVLAHHQPGRLGRLLGCRMNSVFILDLHDPLFGFYDRLGVDAVFISLSRQGPRDRSVVNGLVEALFVAAFHQTQATETVRRETDSEKVKRDAKVVDDAFDLLPNASYPVPLAHRLARVYDPHTASWLLTRLQGYAEQLLSYGWGTLIKGQGGPDDPVARVINAIASDFPEGVEPLNRAESPKVPPEGAEGGCYAQAETDTDARAPHLLYAPHVTLLYVLAHHLAVRLQNWLIDVTPKPGDECLRELSFTQVPADQQGRAILEMRGYVRRGPLERPMNFCLIPADQEGRSLWKLRGYLRRGSGHRPVPITPVMLDPIKSDMLTWLSERPAIVDPVPRARKS